MSKEDDAIIEAVVARLRDCKALAGDPLARTLSAIPMIDALDENSGDVQHMVEVMLTRIAKEAVLAVRRWDAEHGFVTVAKGVTQAMQDAGVLALREPSGRPGRIVSRVYREAIDASPTPPGAE